MAKSKKAAQAEEAIIVDLSGQTEVNAELIFEMHDETVGMICNDFGSRKDPVTFHFADEEVTTNLGTACIALAVLPAFTAIRENLLSTDFDFTEGDINKRVSKAFDKIFETASNSEEVEAAKPLVAEAIERLARASYKFNEIAGNTVNLHDLIMLVDRNPKVYEILRMQVNERSEYRDVVIEIDAARKALVKAIMEDPEDNCMKAIVGTVSPGQFQQVFCAVGYKPEVVSSAIYPHCVNTNLIMGHRNPMDYYVSAMGARKALLTNFSLVRKSGYTSRKLLLLVMNQMLSKETDDCETEHLVEFEIKTKDALERLVGRWAEAPVGKKGKREMVCISRQDEHLIGKTVYLRSPMTCQAHDGICLKCYGKLGEMNTFHPAISGVLTLTEQLTQRLLSSKHLLQINPERVELPAPLPEYFSIDKTNLVAKKSFRLYINDLEEEDDEIICRQITIIDGDRTYEVVFEEGKELFPDPIMDRLDIYGENTLDFEEGDEVFRLNVENTELVTPLKRIIRLLESEQMLNAAPFEAIFAEFMELLERSDVRCSAATIEVILRELMRNPEDVQHRPTDFNNVKVMKLTNALVHHPSAAITLSFERLNYVVENNLFMKDQDSLIDALF
jgi:hypothetical protein